MRRGTSPAIASPCGYGSRAPARKPLFPKRLACRRVPTLDHLEWPFASRRRECAVEEREGLGIEGEARGGAVLANVLDVRGLRDHDEVGVAKQPRERDARRGDARGAGKAVTGGWRPGRPPVR